MFSAQLLQQAGAALQQGRLGEAESLCARVLQAAPQDAAAQYQMALVKAALQRTDEALAHYDAALAANPAMVEAWNNRGSLLWDRGRLEAALESYDRAIVLRPDVPGLWQNRAHLLVQMMRFAEAVGSFDRLLTLSPGNAKAWAGRGSALRWLRHYDGALASYDRALAISPRDCVTLNNRAIVLCDLGRIEEALECYDRAIAANPGYAEGLFNRATMQWVERARLGPAIADLERAVAADPAFPYAQGLLLHLKMYACDWRGFEAAVARLDDAVRAGAPAAEPFVYQAVSASPADLLRCAATHAAHRYPPSPARFRVRSHDRIRLGYVSGEFRAQATAYLMAEMYERHDRARFEIFAFDNGLDDGSPMRRRLEAAFAGQITPITGLSDGGAAEAIMAAQIDILVNLNGYFGDHRMGIFAQRPAPIQVNYLGFPGTLGADTIDYIIADETVIPPGEEKYYTEQVVRLPGSYQVNDAKREIAADIPAKADCGLPAGTFVFCNFNSCYKLTPGTFAEWMAILAAVPGSVLWLLENNTIATANLRREAEARGVAGERLVFAPMIALSSHLARLGLADLFLDSLPYNGHTTASDALWAGVPVLTQRGTAFAGRVAASLLKAVGLPELITETPEQYRALALSLARDPSSLHALKAKLAANRRTMPLFDAARFTRNIESAYARMMETFRQGAVPRGFRVD
ncbi:MAG TPA: tetratricopeptide repeat protein [Rhizomicrobium sp.]|nr:tetratricopeptide repeat protein [Rhizomicrobium sp.]